jgi:hypothetical protein
VDDLLQLLFFAALILFALVGSARKKRRPPVQGPPPRVRRPQVETRESVAGTSRVESAGAPPRRQRGIAQELLELLQERVEIEQPTPPAPPPPPPPPPPRRPPREPVVFRDEAQSLETLEPAGGKSHERFHELYMHGEKMAKGRKPEAHEPYEDLEHRMARLELSRHKLQQAFIMKEILSPPKGLE